MRIIGLDDGTSPARVSSVLPPAAYLSEHTKERVSAAAPLVEWAENELRAIGLKVLGRSEEGRS
jgi:hypothetical protein